MTTNTEVKKLKLTFCGGAGSVTGANFLIEEADEKGEVSLDGTKILVDCGMEQGEADAYERNRKKFMYNPSSIQFLIITHAHADHIGLVPKLVRDGFRGVIYSTPETQKLSELMLEDSLKILTQESIRHRETPLYQPEDVAMTLSLWKSIPYHTATEIAPGFSVYLKNSGHVLGSAMVEMTYNKKKIVFTGDLGNSPSPILKDTEKITDADYLLMESVYGDRNHESQDERLTKLEDVIEETARNKSVLVIPSFSLEKTQVIISQLNSLVEAGRVPLMPVFIDSPLAIRITDVYKQFPEDFNDATKDSIKRGDDIFNFPKLHYTERSEQSIAIKNVPGPKIVIAGSGMSTGGRIQHHEINYLGDPNNILLLIGYQAAGTLGRVIQDGEKKVNILGHDVNIKAKIEYISGYSSHKDSDHLFSFVEDTADKVQKVFVVMGETKSALFLVQRLRDYLGLEAFHPEEGESVVLDF